MLIEVDFWNLVLLLVAFIGFVSGAGKVLLRQIDKRLEGRFEAMEESRKESQQHWDKRFSELSEQNRREADGWQQLERDFLKFQAALPIEYVRRDDYIRGQSVIEAKLDALASKLEVVQLKGAKP